VDTIKPLWQKYRHIILYGIIGGFCAGLDFSIYTILCFLSTNYLIANVISVHCGILSSFFLNRHFNFKRKDKTWNRLLSFYVIGLLGLGLSSLILYIVVDIYDLNKIYSKLATVVLVALLQFVLNKHITFKK
jgi:putative flippase GtrA